MGEGVLSVCISGSFFDLGMGMLCGTVSCGLLW